MKRWRWYCLHAKQERPDLGPDTRINTLHHSPCWNFSSHIDIKGRDTHTNYSELTPLRTVFKNLTPSSWNFPSSVNSSLHCSVDRAFFLFDRAHGDLRWPLTLYNSFTQTRFARNNYITSTWQLAIQEKFNAGTTCYSWHKHIHENPFTISNRAHDN